MFTSNYAGLSAITPPLAPVSISRGKPRWKGGWLADCQPGAASRNYDALAPTWAALKGSEDDYHRAFAQLLAVLDPARTYAELGDNAVLLCFCPVAQTCHRRIVAEWFEYHLKVIVPELGTADRNETPQWVTHAYDWYHTAAPKGKKFADPLAADAAETPSHAPEGTPAPRPQIGTRETWNPATGQWEPSM